MHGQTVVITLMKPGEPDRYNNRRLVKDKVISVDDVLVAPDNTGSSAEDGRPYGVTEKIKLYFPSGSGLSGRLRGASVFVFGRSYKVQGDPLAWPNVFSTLMRYDLEVEAVRIDG